MLMLCSTEMEEEMALLQAELVQVAKEREELTKRADKLHTDLQSKF